MASKEVSVSAYDHGLLVDKKKGKVKCNYCGKVVSGSTRLKCHLGGIRGDVTPCEVCPESVKEAMKNVLLEKKKGLLSKEVGELDHPNLPLKRNFSPETKDIGHDSTLTERNAKQLKIESVSVKQETKPIAFPKRMDFELAVGGNGDQSVLHAKRSIGRFFYETGVDFSAATVPSIQRMISSIFGSQSEHMIPTCQELKGWILQTELKEVQQYVQEIRKSWETTGCSILLDGWVGLKGRELVNILVDCPKGAIYLNSFDISDYLGDFCKMHSFLDRVLEEVGISNVVQVITYSTSEFMETLGRQVMDKYQSIFWTASASHCIEMMLDKIGTMNQIKRTIEKAKTITRFIYNHAFVLKLLKNHTQGLNLIKPTASKMAAPFVTLENILLQEDSLHEMFTSSDWKTSIWATTDEGKRVTQLVSKQSFWHEARKVLSATIPLVRALDLINEGDNQSIGYIYETLDQAKETISDEFENKESEFMPFWEVIDDVWDNRLHSHLHAAAYVLNPLYFYSTGYASDPELTCGLMCSAVRVTGSKQFEDNISSQLLPYQARIGKFGDGGGNTQLSSVSPGQRFVFSFYPVVR